MADDEKAGSRPTTTTANNDDEDGGGGVSSASAGSTIDNPRDEDVLLGRGKPFQTHQGNVSLNSYIQQHKLEYQSAKKADKRRIGQAILSEFQRRGVRFLKRVDESPGAPSPFPPSSSVLWLQVSDDEAIDKICHTLRKNKPDSSVEAPPPGGTGATTSQGSKSKSNPTSSSRKRRRSTETNPPFPLRAAPNISLETPGYEDLARSSYLLHGESQQAPLGWPLAHDQQQGSALQRPILALNEHVQPQHEQEHPPQLPQDQLLQLLSQGVIAPQQVLGGMTSSVLSTSHEGHAHGFGNLLTTQQQHHARSTTSSNPLTGSVDNRSFLPPTHPQQESLSQAHGATFSSRDTRSDAGAFPPNPPSQSQHQLLASLMAHPSAIGNMMSMNEQLTNQLSTAGYQHLLSGGNFTPHQHSSESFGAGSTSQMRPNSNDALFPSPIAGLQHQGNQALPQPLLAQADVQPGPPVPPSSENDISPTLAYPASRDIPSSSSIESPEEQQHSPEEQARVAMLSLPGYGKGEELTSEHDIDDIFSSPGSSSKSK